MQSVHGGHQGLLQGVQNGGIALVPWGCWVVMVAWYKQVMELFTVDNKYTTIGGSHLPGGGRWWCPIQVLQVFIMDTKVYFSQIGGIVSAAC